MVTIKLLRRALLVSCLFALAAPSAALAQIAVSVDAGGTLGVAVTDATSDITLATGVGVVTVTATATITPTAPCAVDAAGVATCPGATAVSYTGGTGPDALHVTLPFTPSITADGGAGDDSLSGGDGNDSLTGDAGNDSLSGGAGDDSLDSFDGAVDASVTCGAGTDRLIADNTLDGIDVAGCETIAPEFGPADPRILPADPVVGATLTAAASPSGTASTLQWLWFGCDATGDLATCVPFTDETGPTLTLLPSDVGTTMRVGARADNAAGFATNISAPSGVVHAPATTTPLPPTTTPAPAPAPTRAARLRAFSARVAAIRCGGRACRIRLALAGPVARARMDLRRGSRRIASITRRVRGRVLSVTLRSRRTLTRGTYVLSIRLTATDGRTRTVRRTVRVR
jgi:hypothetical protein